VLADRIVDAYQSGESGSGVITTIDSSIHSSVASMKEESPSQFKQASKTEKDTDDSSTVRIRRNLTRFAHCWDLKEEFVRSSSATERSYLLQDDEESVIGKIQKYGGGRFKANQRPRRQDSIKEAISSFSDLLSINNKKRRERYAFQLRHSLQDMEEELTSFDILFNDEQSKVKSFYYDKLTELEDRLDFVRGKVEHVALEQSRRARRNDESSAFHEDAYESGISPFTATARKHHHKRRSSLGVMIGDFFGQLMNHNEAIDVEAASNQTQQKDHHHLQRVTDVRLSTLLQDDNVNLGGIDDTEDDYGLSDNNNKEIMDDMLVNEKRNAQTESIKRSIVSQYRSAKFLQNYAMLNITGFVKVAKRFDMVVPSKAGEYKKALEASNMMNDARDVEELLQQYETYYANWFCEGDIRAAKIHMLSKRADGLEMDWSQLQFGYRMGMCAVLAIWVCWDCIWGLVDNGDSTIGARTAFPIFRACGGFLLLQWFWGCSVFVWTRYRVNYIYLFDMVPSTVSTPFGIFSQAVNNTLIFLVLMLLYYKV
jgi:hypothetical protein